MFHDKEAIRHITWNLTRRSRFSSTIHTLCRIADKDTGILSWIDTSPEADAESILLAKEKTALATLRADYQFLVMCQEMPLEELQEMIAGESFSALNPDNEQYHKRYDFEKMEFVPEKQSSVLNEHDEHYQKRRNQALIVLEARTGIESFRGVITIRELVIEKSLNRSTLLKAAQRGVFQGRTRQSGTTWLIDTMHESYLAWEQNHLKRGL